MRWRRRIKRRLPVRRRPATRPRLGFAASGPPAGGFAASGPPAGGFAARRPPAGGFG
jgi:hypothetical protein